MATATLVNHHAEFINLSERLSFMGDCPDSAFSSALALSVIFDDSFVAALSRFDEALDEAEVMLPLRILVPTPGMAEVYRNNTEWSRPQASS